MNHSFNTIDCLEQEKISEVENSLSESSERDYLKYNCKYCLYGSDSLESFVRHENAHAIPEPPQKKELRSLYSCDFCKSKFVQKKEFEEHKKSHVIGMSCSLCNYTVPNRNLLKNHVRSHENKYSFQCLLCCERMTSQKMLDSHINKHVLTLSSCKWCRFTTDTPSRLKAHFQIHMKTKQIRCESCDYICFVEGDLKEHRTIHEADTKEDKADAVSSPAEQSEVPAEESKEPEEKHCAQETVETINVKRLLKRALFKCSICGELQKSEETLRRHSLKHIMNKRFSCHICPFIGKDREEIMQHITGHLPFVDLTQI